MPPYVPAQFLLPLRSMADFNWFRMDDIKGARVVAGFGQAGTVPPDEYVNAHPDPIAVMSQGIARHMNADHANSVNKLVQHFAGFTAERAEMLFCDRYGMDVRAYSDDTNYKVRIGFKTTVEDEPSANNAIWELTREAESALGE